MTLVIGVDPGPTTGIVAFEHPGWLLPNGIRVVQCSANAAVTLVRTLVAQRWSVLLAVERFVVGRGSMRAGQHGTVTRELIGALQSLYEGLDGPLGWRARSASEVKPWATDERLAAAGLLDPTKGMGHARDAARHALYAAVRDCGMPDPLSRKAKR